MAIPTTANVGANISITWSPPLSNLASITAFKVVIRTKDNKFLESSSCVTVGTPLPISCQVPMIVLQSSPFNLVQNDIV